MYICSGGLHTVFDSQGWHVTGRDPNPLMKMTITDVCSKNDLVTVIAVAVASR